MHLDYQIGNTISRIALRINAVPAQSSSKNTEMLSEILKYMLSEHKVQTRPRYPPSDEDGNI